MSTNALRSLPSPVPPTPGQDRHVFVVCTGEACEHAGADGILMELKHQCHHAPGDLRIGASQCLGHCQLAPAMVEDGRILGAVTQRRLRVELMRLGLV
ncbi:MAG TPA: NAD(P)H-dependent oxidoreductase subunit E [Paludibaculum sp.]